MSVSVAFKVFSRALCNGERSTLIGVNGALKMNNYTDYLSNSLGKNDSQYYEQSTEGNYSDLNNNLSPDNYDLNYGFTKQRNLNNLPVNYYHENYSALLNATNPPHSTTSTSSSQLSLHSNKFNQSRRLFHRNSIICSSMQDKHGTLNGENCVPVKRSIDQIEELIANKSLFQADLSTASPSISSERNNMITNSSIYDEENYSLYNSTLSPNLSNQSRQHSLAKRSLSISRNATNLLPKLMPIFEYGRFSNPFDSWRDRTLLGTIKFLLTPASINLPRNRKDLNIILPVVKPIISNLAHKDKLRVSWIGHATVMVQFEQATILTDPHFSSHAHPFKLSFKRYRPTPITIEELPDSLNLILISHNHYDHLDYDSVVKLNKRFGKQLTWFVPLRMKSWFSKLNIDNVIELNWWESSDVLDDLKIVSTPAQHWSRRGIFDENKELWTGYSVIGKKFRFYFAGDTGYNDKLFKTIGQEYGPFDLAAIPIGAYEPNNFLKYQHVNPKEAVFIHKDIKSNFSLAIHWGTFPLSNEPYLEPPIKLRAACEEENIPKDRFLAFEHGETRLLSMQGVSKRENVNRYAK